MNKLRIMLEGQIAMEETNVEEGDEFLGEVLQF